MNAEFHHKAIILPPLAVLMLCCFLLGGCTSLLPDEKKVETTPAKPVRKLIFWRVGTDQLEGLVWRDFIQRFEANHPGVSVEYAEVPFGIEMETKLNASYAEGNPPDIVAHYMTSVAERAALGQYEPLDLYLQDWPQKEDILDSLLLGGMYKDKLYGLGFGADPRIFVWRKDFFKEAGLDPDKPPNNWKELADYAVKLTRKEEGMTIRAGLDIPYMNGGFIWPIFVLQNNGQLFDTEKNEPMLTRREVVEATEYLTNLIKLGVSIPNDGYNPRENLFAAGKAAMAYVLPSVIYNMIKADPGIMDQIGFSGPVTGRKKISTLALRFLFMSSLSQNKELAVEFMKSALTKEEVWNRYKIANFPVVLKSLKDDYIRDNPEFNTTVFETVSAGQGSPKVIYATRMYEIITEFLEMAFYGKRAPEDALKEAEEKMKKEFYNAGW